MNKTFSDQRKIQKPKFDAIMKPLGFIADKVHCAYWKPLTSQEDLCGVAAFSLSRHGNASFCIYLSPVWKPSLLPDRKFPHDIGFHAQLSDHGVGKRPQSYLANRPDLDSHLTSLFVNYGLPYLDAFADPEHLLRCHPDPVLAKDLGHTDLALELAIESISKLYFFELAAKELGLKQYQTNIVHADFYRNLFESLNPPPHLRTKLKTEEIRTLRSEADRIQIQLQEAPKSRFLRDAQRLIASHLSEQPS